MPGNELGFVGPGRPIFLRPGQNPAINTGMSLPVAPTALAPEAGLNVPAGIARLIGQGEYGNAFDNLVGVTGSTFLGLQPQTGSNISRATRNVVGGFIQGRRARRTAANAQRGSGGSTPPAATGTNPRRSRRRRDESPSSGRGGNPIVVGSDKPNFQMPSITGHLSTIEGGPLPTSGVGSELDYVSQLHVATYSLATWDTNSSNPYTYNPNSIKNEQVELIFSRLLNDLFAQVTTKFTDEFNIANFRKYMQTFISALEYITFIESVLAYDSKAGYSDKFIANEHLQETYSSFEMIDTIKRLKSVLKNKYFPPKMVGLIHSTFQLHKAQNIEQSVNFRFCPIPRGVPILAEVTAQNTLDTVEATIRGAAIDKMEEYITTLSSRDMTLVSKAIGFIRPSYIFNTNPSPVSAPVFSPAMVELMINLPRLYRADDNNFRNVFPSAEKGKDRVYVVPQEVSQLNDVVFAMQSQPVAKVSVDSATDFVNFGTTFPLDPAFTNSQYGNCWSMTTKDVGGVLVPGFELEGAIQSFAIGRSNILVYNNTVGTVLPDKKYSITPSNCQRVYFNNTFAPTDAVRKLVDDVLDMN
jgi:hypothetical protein